MQLQKRSFDEIAIDDVASRDVHVTSEMIDRFAELSGDFSPIHVDHEAALARGFPDRVVHGFLTGALVSSVIGMLLPGEYGLLHEIQLQFRQPVYPNDLLAIQVQVRDKNDTFRLIFLQVTVLNQNQTQVCSGKIQMSLAR